MRSAPRFAMGTIHASDTEASPLRAEHERAVDDFLHAFPNVLMLGPSLRADSSFTKNAVRALVTLLIAERRLCGEKAHLNAEDILQKHNIPQEIRPLFLERVEGEMQRRLAFGPERFIDPGLQEGIVEKIRRAFGSKN